MFSIWHMLEPQAILQHAFNVILCFLVLVFATIWLFFATTTSKKNNLPPSPPKLPIMGNLHQLGLHPHRYLQSLAQFYGPIMLLHLGRKPTVVVSSAELAREIMKTHDITFANRPDSRIASRLLYDHKDLSLSSYGEYWRHMRSICVLQLLSMKRVRSFRCIREEEAILMVKKIMQSFCCSSAVNLSELLASFSTDVICRIAFGMKCSEGEGRGKLKDLLEELGALLGAFDVGDYIPWLSWLNYVTGLNARVEKNFQGFDMFLDEVVDNHITRRSETVNGIDKDQMDFVDVLLEVQNDCTYGVCMSRDNIKAIILDMFAGGADTTYAVMEWAMTEALRHPEVMKKVQEEVRGIAGSKPYINEDDIAKMGYLKAVIRETLRLHPPLTILLPRMSSKDVQVGGYNISANTRVLINAWAIARSPASWEDPEKFRPERFLDTTLDFKGRDFQFLPFGAGRRGCPGSTLAIANVGVALASLLHKFNWALPGDANCEHLDVTESTGQTIHRKFPLIVLANPVSI